VRKLLKTEQEWDMGPGDFLDYTVWVGRHEYRVYEKYEADQIGSRFILCGPRDSRYILTPNAHNPRMLFPVNLRTGNPQTVFGNLWFKVGDDCRIAPLK
jgi:hypothetical protein